MNDTAMAMATTTTGAITESIPRESPLMIAIAPPSSALSATRSTGLKCTEVKYSLVSAMTLPAITPMSTGQNMPMFFHEMMPHIRKNEAAVDSTAAP